MTTPILYAHPFSSYCQKAQMAFYEKDVAFELRHLESPGAMEALKGFWPLRKFPVLEVDGRAWIETSVIIEWLDGRHPEPRLIPADLDAALEVRMLDRMFDNYVMSQMQVYVN